jgi:hypothetical protein
VAGASSSEFTLSGNLISRRTSEPLENRSDRSPQRNSKRAGGRATSARGDPLPATPERNIGIPYATSDKEEHLETHCLRRRCRFGLIPQHRASAQRMHIRTTRSRSPRLLTRGDRLLVLRRRDVKIIRCMFNAISPALMSVLACNMHGPTAHYGSDI